MDNIDDNNKDSDNIVLFDMDSTLCDYDSAMKRDYDLIRSPGDPEFESYSEALESMPYIKNRIKMIRNQPDWWKNLEKFKLGFDILDVAKELGFDVHILTKAPKSSLNAFTQKAQWINDNLGSNINITISDDKSLVYGKVLVDDLPKYASQWLLRHPRGLVIMPYHNHNKDYSHPNVLHYDGTNIEEVRRVLEIAKNRVIKEKVDYKLVK